MPFHIKKGTKAYVLKIEIHINDFPPSIFEIITSKDLVFLDNEICDLKYIPNYKCFKREGWLILIDKSYVHIIEG